LESWLILKDGVSASLFVAMLGLLMTMVAGVAHGAGFAPGRAGLAGLGHCISATTGQWGAQSIAARVALAGPVIPARSKCAKFWLKMANGGAACG
jgi:hypothetical protein